MITPQTDQATYIEILRKAIDTLTKDFTVQQNAELMITSFERVVEDRYQHQIKLPKLNIQIIHQ